MKTHFYSFKLPFLLLALLSMHTVLAQSSSNRLRAVVPKADVKSCTYEFYNGDTSESDNLVQKQIVLDGEMLLSPEIPQNVDAAFLGWFAVGADADALPLSFAEPIVVTKTETVKLQARFSDHVYVHFIIEFAEKEANEEKGVLKVATTRGLKKGDPVNLENIPMIYPEGKIFDYWSLEKQVQLADKPTPFDNEVGITENTSLYAVYKPGYRVSFRMRGGKAIPAKYYVTGDKLDSNISEEEKPTRAGYSFKGWRKKDAKNENLTDESLPNFEDSNLVEENLTLYALWNKETATYKVAHWQQNADDDGYSYVEIDNKEGQTESEAVYEAKDYSGFTLNEVKTDNLKTLIDGFGTTVKHVFYDRKTYTLSFEKEGEEPKKFENIKYGAKTDKHWNQVAETNSLHLFSTVLKEDNQTIYYTHPPRMPNEDFVIKLLSTEGQKYTVYYKDKATNSELLPSFSFKYDSKKEGKYIKLYPKGTSVVEGFIQEVYELGDKKLNFVLNKVTGYVEATRFFIRNENYKITFLKKNGDPDAVLVNNISFEEALDNKALAGFKKGETKREGDNFIFGGWFTAEETHVEAEEFVFEGKTMPAQDLMLYAKWEAPTYKVYFHPNNDKNSLPYDSLEYVHNSSISVDKIVEMNATIEIDPEHFYRWFCYKDNHFVRYDIHEPITEDVHLYPTWINPGFTVKYDAGGAGEPIPTDDNIYLMGKDAIVKPATALIAPAGKFFIGWKPSIAAPSQLSLAVRNKRNPNNKLYAPGEKIAVVDNLILTAQWGELPKRTNITYKPNGGQGEDITEYLMNNETHKALPADTFTKEKDEIVRWNTKKDGTGLKVEIGQEIIVNNNAETPNVLYAIWKSTATSVNTVKGNFKLSYYPNPVLTTLTIQSESSIRRLEIVDIFGKSIRVFESVDNKELIIDFSDLIAGYYFAKVQTDEGVRVVKLMKK